MRLIGHLSDLHFGAEDPAVVAALERDLAAQAPHVIVVSGDLTQRARHAQFRAAAAFLARLPQPKVVVPGNHDVPLWDVLRRFARPLHRFRRHIERAEMPEHVDDEVAIVGVNTARSLTWSGGRISLAQIEQLRRRLCALPRGGLRVVVTHHEFVPAPGGTVGSQVGRAEHALRALEACEVDVLLAGHLHRGFTADSAAHYPAATRAILVVQVGTATSWRRRGEANAWNLLATDGDRLELEVRSYDGARFVAGPRAVWRRSTAGWSRQA